MSVIVTDARYRMSLSVIRSLGEAHLRVIAQEEHGISSLDALGFHSRHTAERVLTASPKNAPDRFVDDLLKLGKDGDVLIPVSLASILAVASRIDEVRKQFRVALPPLEVIRTANDKERLLKLASGLGIRVPRTEEQVSGDDPAAILSGLKFPVVVKYREGEALGLSPEQRYAIVPDADAFTKVYREMAERQPSPLVQEYISGDGWGMSAVMDAQSKPVLAFCHRRIREYPVSGGPSCFCESVYDRTLVETGLRLLTALKWYGVAMVEFKRDFATGEFVLMEVNPRFWGSLPLAAASGTNFPLALCGVAGGEDAEHRISSEIPAGTHDLPAYKTGVRMRYIFQDLLSVSGYLKRVPNRAAFLASFVRDLFDPRVVDGVFRMNDPAPGLRYIGRALKRST